MISKQENFFCPDQFLGVVGLYDFIILKEPIILKQVHLKAQM